MKLPEKGINVLTTPEVSTYYDFAIECRRDVSYINKSVANGSLNWGRVFGIHVIVLDDLSQSFKEKCRAINYHRRVKGK